jgi:hypothetical protein
MLEHQVAAAARGHSLSRRADSSATEPLFMISESSIQLYQQHYFFTVIMITDHHPTDGFGTGGRGRVRRGRAGRPLNLKITLWDLKSHFMRLKKEYSGL